MIKKLIVRAVLLALLALSLVGVSTSNDAHAAVTKPACVTKVHWEHDFGDKGFITVWITCGGGDYKFRARAECFPDSGKGKPEWRSGSWRTKNNRKSTAGCTNGYYLESGGYNVWWNPRKYYVLWRYPGTPV